MSRGTAPTYQSGRIFYAGIFAGDELGTLYRQFTKPAFTGKGNGFIPKKNGKSDDQWHRIRDADESFGRIAFKRPLAEILGQPSGISAIRNTITNKVLPELTGGGKILNNNIPEKILIDAGLKPDQYLKLDTPDNNKQRKPWEGGDEHRTRV
ncbi:hypothetical protein HDF23_001097 [Mucilaginibacter lappiensis]|uniref:Uncharacterized protein n=2 Tax=Mucilaginibacter lappiensis TaxID=354630 RepID=A0ABR6PF15_9SPHI|nr:hypothetical protein [Mucilaginibacter lappiensis]